MVVMVVVWVNMVVVMMMRAWVRLRSFGGGLMVGSFSAIGLLVVIPTGQRYWASTAELAD